MAKFAESASEPKTRLIVWWAITNMGGPEVAAPMLEALMSDPDESVRETAARMLAGAFFEEPGVAEGLRYASIHDSSLVVRMLRKTNCGIKSGKQLINQCLLMAESGLSNR